MARTITCECGKLADVDRLIDRLGFVGSTRCECGRLVKIPVEPEDLPDMWLKPSFAALPSDVRADLVRLGGLEAFVDEEEHPHSINEDTPIWRFNWSK